MTVPGAINPSSNTCSSLMSVSAQINVPACYGNWPKVYEGKSPYCLAEDNSNNIFMLVHTGSNISTINVNHIGAVQASSLVDEYTLQYTPSGYTNWTQSSLYNPMHVSSTGEIQYYPPTSYVDGATGAVSAGPSFVPSGERILAETGAGEFITYSYSGSTFSVYTNSGNSGLTSLGTYYKSIFNPTTNKLFCVELVGLSQYLNVYQLSGGSLSLIASNIIPMNYILYGYEFALDQVTPSDLIYTVHNGILQQYNYILNTFTPVSITGLPASNIAPLQSSKLYADDKMAVID